MYIKKSEYPTLYLCYEFLWFDSIPELRPDPQGFRADTEDGWSFKDLPEIEKALSNLTQDELETFCIGEQEDQIAIRDKYHLEKAHSFTESIFETVGI